MDQDENQDRGNTWYQQGDVTIRAVDAIPEDADETGGRVLAEGEATGHKHLAIAEDVLLFMHEGTLFMSAPNGTTIVHEEHRVLEIPPGNYQIGTVLEYDHFADEAHPVID